MTRDGINVTKWDDRGPAASQRFLGRQRRTILLLVVLFIFFFTALAPRTIVIIPAGHGGVEFRTFGGGTVLSRRLTEGLNLLLPWNNATLYNLKLQVDKATYPVVSSEGLHYTIEATFRWRLNPSALPILHRDMGASYEDVMLIPEIGSVLRKVVSQYEAAQVYSELRDVVEAEVYERIVSRSRYAGGYQPRTYEDSGYLLYLENILIRDVVLPEPLISAIERKLEQAEIANEYVFRVAREKLEAERKSIEAEGILQFTRTVQAGLTEPYLQWRGIEATLQLAQSNNAKVVVIGGGADGLPLILNTGSSEALPTSPEESGPSAETEVDAMDTPLLNYPAADAGKR